MRQTPYYTRRKQEFLDANSTVQWHIWLSMTLKSEQAFNSEEHATGAVTQEGGCACILAKFQLEGREQNKISSFLAKGSRSPSKFRVWYSARLNFGSWSECAIAASPTRRAACVNPSKPFTSCLLSLIMALQISRPSRYPQCFIRYSPRAIVNSQGIVKLIECQSKYAESNWARKESKCDV